MSTRNKIMVDLYLEDGCSQEKGEVNSSWRPVNFSIYSELFVDLINEAIGEWLSENNLAKNVMYEVTFAHVTERDGGGASLDEYFEPIYQESQEM